jgi:hypothetical protein
MKLGSIGQVAGGACAFAIAMVGPCRAQGRVRSFYEVDAGVLDIDPELGVRGETGAAASLALGRTLGKGFGVQADLGLAAVAAPKQWASLLACYPVACVPPLPSKVRIASFGGSAEYRFAVLPVAPFLLVGAGFRSLTEAPQRGGDARPYAEYGVGVAFGRVSIRARYQGARPGKDLPDWMMPITLGYRF